MTGFRGTHRQAVPGSSRDWVGSDEPDRHLPLIVTPRVDVDLADWSRDHADCVTGWLHRHGAVLFRGFDVGMDRFAAVAESLAGAALPYRERSSPRTQLGPGVYTSTDHPADQAIALHNENSYQTEYPARLVFGCLLPAEAGGETPLADCRRVFARIPPDIVDTFRRRHIRYVRTYGDVVGLSWQEAFQDNDRSRVDEYCLAHGISAHWRPDGGLRTERIGPALATHPHTRETVWFNHAAFFHVSTLDPPVARALIAQFGEDGLPANTYYGDGAPIGAAALDTIRAAYRDEMVAEPWRRGDVLLVDNLLVAHGRAPFRGERRVVVSMAGRLSSENPSPEDGR
jgi:alpha-ketoglutarate-dependent taurine dioxygenase